MVLRVVPPGGADLIVQSLGAGWYMPLSAIGACVGHELPIEPHLLALLAGDYPEAVVLDFAQPFRPRAAAALMSASLISSSAGVEAIRAGIMKGTLLDGFPSASSHWAEAFGELERERLRLNGRDLPRMCHQQLAEAILLSTRSSMKQASNS